MIKRPNFLQQQVGNPLCIDRAETKTGQLHIAHYLVKDLELGCVKQPNTLTL